MNVLFWPLKHFHVTRYLITQKFVFYLNAFMAFIMTLLLK